MGRRRGEWVGGDGEWLGWVVQWLSNDHLARSKDMCHRVKILCNREVVWWWTDSFIFLMCSCLSHPSMPWYTIQALFGEGGSEL